MGVGDSHDRTLSSTFLGPSRAPCRYVKMERIVLYDCARPCTSREVVLGDKLTCRLNQHLDDFERATPDRDRYSTRSQSTPRQIDLPLLSLIHQPPILCAHSRPLFRISHVSSEFSCVQAARGRLPSQADDHCCTPTASDFRQ